MVSLEPGQHKMTDELEAIQLIYMNMFCIIRVIPRLRLFVATETYDWLIKGHSPRSLAQFSDQWISIKF